VLLLLLLLRRYATDVRDRLVDFLDKTVGFKAGTAPWPHRCAVGDPSHWYRSIHVSAPFMFMFMFMWRC